MRFRGLRGRAALVMLEQSCHDRTKAKTDTTKSEGCGSYVLFHSLILFDVEVWHLILTSHGLALGKMTNKMKISSSMNHPRVINNRITLVDYVLTAGERKQFYSARSQDHDGEQWYSTKQVPWYRFMSYHSKSILWRSYSKQAGRTVMQQVCPLHETP